MARFAVGAAALFALCRADGVGNIRPQPGQYGHDDSKEGAGTPFLYPSKVPGHDKCSIDCVRICEEGLGRKGHRNMMSKSDCQSACYAHSIETPHKKSSPFDTNHQQGKYVQKVMSEYCSRRGACGQGLLQASAVQKHEVKEGEAYSPNTWKGDPRAVSSGWPSGCEDEDYYCQELCQNVYHKATGSLGEHPGAGKSWSSDQKKCKQDCKSNFKAMTEYWDEWCTCLEGPGGDMHLEKVPGLLQEPVDVGSFMQVPKGEL